jgi:hypothetical protein
MRHIEILGSAPEAEIPTMFLRNCSISAALTLGQDTVGQPPQLCRCCGQKLTL